jgi:hypothetical protein
VESAKWTGQRVREVSTSFINSLSLAANHWARKGPETAERKVRGEPDGLRLCHDKTTGDNHPATTGWSPVVDPYSRTGAEEGETVRYYIS